MVQLFKYTFIRIYFFYQKVLQVKQNANYYASFVLALLMFANVYVVINAFNLMALGQMNFDYRSPYFIVIGNVLVFSSIFFVSFRQRYKLFVEEFSNLSKNEKKKLGKEVNTYVVISLAFFSATLFIKLML